jgi:hypothetical protein
MVGSPLSIPGDQVTTTQRVIQVIWSIHALCYAVKCCKDPLLEVHVQGKTFMRAARSVPDGKAAFILCMMLSHSL